MSPKNHVITLCFCHFAIFRYFRVENLWHPQICTQFTVHLCYNNKVKNNDFRRLLRQASFLLFKPRIVPGVFFRPEYGRWWEYGVPGLPVKNKWEGVPKHIY